MNTTGNLIESIGIAFNIFAGGIVKIGVVLLTWKLFTIAAKIVGANKGVSDDQN